MKKITPYERADRIRDFMERAQDLTSDIKDLREMTLEDGEDRIKLFIRREEKRYKCQVMMNTLMRELRSFFKVAYGAEGEYYPAIINIRFYNENEQFTDTDERIETSEKMWLEAFNNLMDVLISAASEEREQIRLDSHGDNRSLPFRYASAGIGFCLCILGLWGSPNEIFFTIFDPVEILKVRIGLSIGAALLLLIVIDAGRWKELLISALIPFCIAILPFFKKSPLPIPAEKKLEIQEANKESPSTIRGDGPAGKKQTSGQQVDTTQKSEKRPQGVLSDTSTLDH